MCVAQTKSVQELTIFKKSNFSLWTKLEQGVERGEGGKRERALGGVGKGSLSVSRFSLGCEQVLRGALAPDRRGELARKLAFLSLPARFCACHATTPILL